MANISERIKEWAESPDGQEQLRETARKIRETEAQLKEDSKIPWIKMYEPVTI